MERVWRKVRVDRDKSEYPSQDFHLLLLKVIVENNMDILPGKSIQVPFHLSGI
jgi:hypothetical protein